MATTIQISEDLQKELSDLKLFDRETYEEIIWDLIEDAKELNKETIKDIRQAQKEISQGKYYTFSQAKEKLGL